MNYKVGKAPKSNDHRLTTNDKKKVKHQTSNSFTQRLTPLKLFPDHKGKFQSLVGVEAGVTLGMVTVT